MTTGTRALPTWALALIVPLVAGLAVLVTALASGEDAATAPAAARAGITIEDFTFAPDPFEVGAGATIEVTNSDGVQHTLSADDGTFDTGIIDGSGSSSIVVPGPGTYAFTCQIHPSMTGTLVAS